MMSLQDQKLNNQLLVVNLNDLRQLADLISDMDMANAGIGEQNIPISVEKAHALIEVMAGEYSDKIYIKEDQHE